MMKQIKLPNMMVRQILYTRLRITLSLNFLHHENDIRKIRVKITIKNTKCSNISKNKSLMSCSYSDKTLKDGVKPVL